jgi:hypothetical protein
MRHARPLSPVMNRQPEDTVGRWVGEKRKSRQHFDVWNFAKAAGESSYFGRDFSVVRPAQFVTAP